MGTLRKITKSTEKQIETLILDWLNYQPATFAFKVNTTGIFDPVRKIYRTIKNKHIHKGTSDIIGMKKGIFFAIEVKRPSQMKKVTEEQITFQRKVAQSQGRCSCLCSLEQAIAFFQTIS